MTDIKKTIRESCLFENRWDSSAWYHNLDWFAIFLIGMVTLLVVVIVWGGFAIAELMERAVDMADLSCDELYGVINDIPEFEDIYIHEDWDRISAVYNSRCKA